jgi:hypothetical protein
VSILFSYVYLDGILSYDNGKTTRQYLRLILTRICNCSLSQIRGLFAATLPQMNARIGLGGGEGAGFNQNNRLYSMSSEGRGAHECLLCG